MDVSKLQPGDEHYMAYIGYPAEYDFMGATQFRLLCTLGLRAGHFLLDFGCGSLRAGRLFISYLDEGRYFGIEPNKWLIEEAVQHQLGRDLVHIKKPRFDHNPDFRTDVFEEKFDFIIAQSIFSHAGADLISATLRNFKGSLKPGGIVAATFVDEHSLQPRRRKSLKSREIIARDFDGKGWVYPQCVNFRGSTVQKMAADAGLNAVRIPWYHPRQTWYLMAGDKKRLPDGRMFRHLSGAVLFDPAFAESLTMGKRAGRHKLLERVKSIFK